MNGMWFTDDAYVDFDRVMIIFKNGETYKITGNNGFKLLTFLSKNSGHISSEQMIEAIWPDSCNYTSVNLNHEINNIRNWFNDRSILPYERGSRDYVFTPPTQKEPPKVKSEETAKSLVSSVSEHSVEDDVIQKQLIYGINTAIEVMNQQMMSAIGHESGGAYEHEIGEYIYDLGLDKSISVYEGMMDLLKLDKLTDEEKGSVGNIYMRIASYYCAMSKVKKDSSLNAIAWQKLNIAANLGNSTAMQNIAFAFYNGDMGVSKSENDAREWYKKAIAAGCKAAAFQFSKYFPGESAE